MTTHMSAGYRISALCETCGVHRGGFLAGDTGEDVDALIRALCTGWERVHEDHDQIVVASYATLEIAQVLYTEPGAVS
jgi:hypothetical protein